MTKVGGESCNPSLDYEVRPCDYFGQLDVSMNPIVTMKMSSSKSPFKVEIEIDSKYYTLSSVRKNRYSYRLSSDINNQVICTIDYSTKCDRSSITVVPSAPNCKKMSGVMTGTNDSAV